MAKVQYERECENPDASTVGRNIARSRASGRLVHGQFGTTSSPPWPAQPGYVEYEVETPQMDHLYLTLRYSKYSPSTVPIDCYVDGQLKASFTPSNQRSWNLFAWTDVIDLGSVDGGITSIRLRTEGQQYGVVDLDVLQLADCIAD
jgi:hypothetical protein